MEAMYLGASLCFIAADDLTGSSKEFAARRHENTTDFKVYFIKYHSMGFVDIVK